MLPPLIRRPIRNVESDSRQRGFTMAFVAITMVVIVSMAALAIDIGTLYQAKAEAQRAADAAALAAAQVISTSGITTDPTNGQTDGSWSAACGGSSSLATLAAISVAQQNLIAGTPASTSNIHVYYGTSAGVGTNTSCTGAGAAFGVNPVVEVSVQQTKLPTFFARIFSLIPGGTSSNSGVSATAAAEAFNPSGSSPMIPVQPRCVKPWMVPNQDPGHSTLPFVHVSTGAILKPGVSTTGVIGETFDLFVDCGPSGRNRGRCVLADTSPVANGPRGVGTLDYIPAQVLSPSVAIAANTNIDGCAEATHNDYSKAVAGCDQTTVYACGVSGGNTVELTEDPGPPRNDSVNGAACLINAGGDGLRQGQDVLATYPFQIEAGSNSALVAAGISSGSQITSSPSIVSLPIYDNSVMINPTGTTAVTVIGFLQVFINSVDSVHGKINVTVMNIAGCGNGSSPSPVALGTSPVPVRLISIP
ncbi:MAG TPA: pilus assembly protein TadG-related protein [Candidatus Polarisedimenticolia bacterium]|nr:pilus assembly protein TadG-related protein [Candidatus Polarisedimenticolia bacterium]